MKFYVASSFKNIEIVRDVVRRLCNKGHIQTYDWTENKDVTTFVQLRDIGQKEKEAVIESDCIIVVFPAGKGSHVELGIALGMGKKIYLYSPDNGINNFENTSTFYHLPEVNICTGTVEELISRIALD
jgi:hypothetical protein